MINLSLYYKKIKEYNDNLITLEQFKKELKEQYNNFIQLGEMDNAYFKNIDDELKKNNLFFFEDLLIDENVYNNMITYNTYIKKIITNEEIDIADIDKISKTIKFTLEISNLLSKFINDIIKKYIRELVYTDSKNQIVEIYFNNKFKNITIENLGLRIDDYYEISNNMFDNYKLKSDVNKKLNNIKSNFNNYITSIKEHKIDRKYDIVRDEEQIKKISSIIKDIKYDSIQNSLLQEKPDDMIAIIGGAYDIKKDNELIKNRTYIITALNHQEKLINYINKINNKINEYFKTSYDIFYYNLFIINEQEKRTYSLFVYKSLPYELIEKIYNDILSIPELKKERYDIVFSIINSYLLTQKLTKQNLSVGKNLEFILLVDKLNILLQQYNKLIINKTISCKYNSHDIFVLGDRPLDNLYIYYDITQLNLKSNEEKIEFLGKLMFYFLLPNLYLIHDIEYKKIIIWKLEDLLLLKYINNTSLHSSFLNNENKLIINNKDKYIFINYNNVSPSSLKNNHLIINFTI